MQALTDERWNEIRSYQGHTVDLQRSLAEVLKQHDHLAAQIKLLADYIMSERPDDPARGHTTKPLEAGACAMAVEIMKREKKEIESLEALAKLGIHAMRETWDNVDIDYEDMQTAATSLGVIKEVKYDPDIHGEHECFDKGDPYFEFQDYETVLKLDANQFDPKKAAEELELRIGKK